MLSSSRCGSKQSDSTLRSEVRIVVGCQYEALTGRIKLWEVIRALERSIGGWADDRRGRSSACQVCEYPFDPRPSRRLLAPTLFHQFPSPVSKPNLLRVVGFWRSCPIYHTVCKIKNPTLLIMKWLESAENFVYHHPQSVDICRLSRSSARSAELGGT